MRAKVTLVLVWMILLVAGAQSMALEYKVWADAKSDRNLLLISGPNHNWHSDSAWFVALGPQLQKAGFRAVAVERDTVTRSDAETKVGYCQFAAALGKELSTKVGSDYAIIALASGNLAVHCLLAQPDIVQPRFVILIDPDALSPYAMSRYIADAQPFADNLDAYLDYVAAGKYAAQAEEKNRQDWQHLQQLLKDSALVDWVHAKKVFEQRLQPGVQQNLMREIAAYAADLQQAAAKPLPQSLPLLILDTDFEQEAIDQQQDAQQKSALERWRVDAASYYRSSVARQQCGIYRALDSREHLLPLAQPELLVKWSLRLWKASAKGQCPASGL